MSVHFIIGRAGTGKTYHCLAAIQKELVRDSVGGPRLVLLVPEQASLQMERALLSGPVRATARAEVLSFCRLALRVLQSAGAPMREALSPAARAMVLRRIVARLGGELRYYRRVERLTGFFDRLGRTVSELIEENVAPADLRGVEFASGGEAGQREKLADLADIYAAYLDYLGEGRLDSSQYLQMACEALSRCVDFDGARFWVDGFAGFTGQELALLRDLAVRAGSVELTLLVDPEGFAAAEGARQVDPTDLFARPLRTYLRLQGLLVDAGCTVDAPLVLRPEAPPRYADSRDLAALEARFGAPMTDDRLARSPEVPARIRGDASKSTDVCFAEMPDRRTEVAYAVAQVCALTWREAEPLRYRDIAIACRDLTAYHDLLSASLRERGVPFFIDRRRSLAHHPLVELLRGAAAVAAGGAAVEPMRLLLKTDLLGIDAEDADALENYVLAHGLAGAAAWTGGDWQFSVTKRGHGQADPRDARRLVRLNASRRRIVEVLGPFCAVEAAAMTAVQWAEELRGLLGRADVDESIASWALRAEGDGEVERAAEHRQALDAVHGFLVDLGGALGDERLAADELAAVVEAGLAELTLGLVPPTVDQVLVGSIERSRHPDIKVSILLGFNDGVFPAQAAEDVVLNDEDRKALAGCDVHVGVTRRQRVLDERMLAYVAVTRASRKLLVTSALADEDGKALRPSTYLGELRRALPALTERRIDDPAQAGQVWPVWTAQDLAAALALELGRRVAGGAVGVERRRQWNDIYALARTAEDARFALAPALSALVFANEAGLSAGSVEALIEAPYTASVSELESHAACPFQRFCRFGLRLRPRREADLQPVDVGSVHHAILEAFLNECLERKERFSDVRDADVLPRLERCAERIGTELHREGEVSSARDAYMLARSARDLSTVVQSQTRVAAGGRFAPRAAERKYGFADDPASLQAVEIMTPLGRRVRIRGVIDRVDLAEVGDELVGVVVDYKRTRDKRLDLTQVYHGLSLQLLGYLLALAERGETLAGRAIVPVGAFYVSLLRKYRAVDAPDEVQEEDGPDELVPRGVFDGARIELLESDMPETGRGRVFKIYRKQDGALGYMDAYDATTSAQFVALLAHTRQRLGSLADGVLDGDVTISPYRLKDFSPCHWCDMRSVCRFEFGDSGMRHLPAMKRSEVLERLEGA